MAAISLSSVSMLALQLLALDTAFCASKRLNPKLTIADIASAINELSGLVVVSILFTLPAKKPSTLSLS